MRPRATGPAWRRWAASRASSPGRGGSDGPAAGLALLGELRRRGELDRYYLLWSAEADLLRRLGRDRGAAESYRRALERIGTEPERRFLERRLAEVERR